MASLPGHRLDSTGPQVQGAFRDCLDVVDACQVRRQALSSVGNREVWREQLVQIVRDQLSYTPLQPQWLIKLV